MNHKIDLHGMSHKEAISKTETLLIGASFDKAMVVEIITGKSKTLQDKIITELLDLYKFDYYIPSYNIGIIIVTQNEL
jgi:hypothetical protein